MQDWITYWEEGVKELNGGIREEQKHYVTLLRAQTDEYIRQMREFESSCLEPGADVKELQTEITLLTETMLDACAEFEKNVHDPFAVKAAQVEFREKTNPILSKSYCINRTRIWPQGHQGDYNTLEFAYKNTPLSEGIGYYLDTYMLTAALAQGVRERVAMLRKLLREELLSRRSPKVLDVACGSCREVFELAPEIKASGARFTCVDLDDDALNYALDRFRHAGLTEDHADVRKYNALRIFDFETAHMEFGPQDVIYSVGYFDYLPDDFLVKLLNSLYRLLTPGGKLVAAFKDAARYRPEIYHWLVNWDGFLQRTEVDFERLLSFTQIPADAISMKRVDSGTIIFYSAVKTD